MWARQAPRLSLIWSKAPPKSVASITSMPASWMAFMAFPMIADSAWRWNSYGVAYQ